MSKKGQIWTIDYIIGLMIFLALIATAVVLLQNDFKKETTYSETQRESEHIAAILLGDAHPNSTQSTNSVIIGINNRINDTRLKNFTEINYNITKLLFQTSGEYVFYFYNGTIINHTKCFYGYTLEEDCILKIPSSADNVAKTERIVILNSSIVRMEVITWN